MNIEGKIILTDSPAYRRNFCNVIIEPCSGGGGDETSAAAQQGCDSGVLRFWGSWIRFSRPRVETRDRAKAMYQTAYFAG